MSVQIVNVTVPISGDGPSANIANLTGTKTVELSGHFQGRYILLGSQNNIKYVPVAIFDSNGVESIKITLDIALSSVRVRSEALSPVDVTVNVSGVVGTNMFASMASIPVGGSGDQPVVDLNTVMPPSGVEQGIAFLCNGSFSGLLTINGSLDGVHFNPIGEGFRGGSSSPSLLGDDSPLEFSPLVTKDLVRYVKVSLNGVATTDVVVTLGGFNPTSGSGGVPMPLFITTGGATQQAVAVEAVPTLPDSSIIVGPNSTLASGSTVIGTGNTVDASSNVSVTIGTSNTVQGAIVAVTIGLGLTNNASYGLLLGLGTSIGTGSSNAIRLGVAGHIGNNAGGSIALGTQSTVGDGANDSTVIGSYSYCNAGTSVSIGLNSGIDAGSTNSVAIGPIVRCNTASPTGVVIGHYSQIYQGASVILIGDSSNSLTSDNSIVLGTQSYLASSSRSIVIGSNSNLVGIDSVSVGPQNSNAGSDYNINLGAGLTISDHSPECVAIGHLLGIGQNTVRSIALGANVLDVTNIGPNATACFSANSNVAPTGPATSDVVAFNSYLDDGAEAMVTVFAFKSYVLKANNTLAFNTPTYRCTNVAAINCDPFNVGSPFGDTSEVFAFNSMVASEHANCHRIMAFNSSIQDDFDRHRGPQQQRIATTMHEHLRLGQRHRCWM